MLILMGPFLDERHACVESGHIDIDSNSFQYDDFFRYLMAAVESRLAATQTEILIQPSTRDVHHPYPFPQPAFENHWTRIKCVNNPQKVVVNGVTIQMLNADVFSDMEIAMISKPKGNYPELTVRALLEQKSLYPIFPTTSGTFPVEHKYREAFALKEQPDIVLVSSVSPCFVCVRLRTP